MAEEDRRQTVTATLRQINQTRLDGRVDDLVPWYTRKSSWSFPVLRGDVAGDTAVVSFRYLRAFRRTIPFDGGGICGCSSSKAARGLPPGGRCSTRKRKKPDGGVQQ